MVGPTPGGIFLGCLFLVLIALTANSTHAIVGTAAPMDIGGRKMAGFASGVIDSFQYYGTAIALPLTGWLIDKYGWGVWYPTMASFGAIGGCSMLLVMRKQRRMTRERRRARNLALEKAPSGRTAGGMPRSKAPAGRRFQPVGIPL